MFSIFSLCSLSILTAVYARPLSEGDVIFITKENASSFVTQCGGRYYGTYHSREPVSIYIGPESCHSIFSFLSGGSEIVRSLGMAKEQRSLVWIEEVVAEGSLRESEPGFRTSLEEFLAPTLSLNEQMILQSRPMRNFEVIWSSIDSAVISVPTKDLVTFDMYLPRLWEAVALPTLPLPLPSSVISKSTTPSDERLAAILSNLKFDPDVSSVLSAISTAQMLFDVRWLTGESSESPIVSRHSFSDGARTAAEWIKARFQEYGAKCRYMDFLEGFAPNVICKYAAKAPAPQISGEEPPVELPRIILSAHYDSRGSFGSTRAPGGDDDGSGITHLLAIARAIYRKKVEFKVDVELVAFAGEEQGLLGSHAYAKELYESEKDVMLMIQADMLAYHSADEPLQLGIPPNIGSAVAAQFLANVSAIYAPELTVGSTYACCSDHQSFWEYGFTSSAVFERAGGIIDPKYHNSGDLSDRLNYDLEQVHSIAKVTLATILHTAGFTAEL